MNHKDVPLDAPAVLLACRPTTQCVKAFYLVPLVIVVIEVVVASAIAYGLSLADIGSVRVWLFAGIFYFLLFQLVPLSIAGLIVVEHVRRATTRYTVTDEYVEKELLLLGSRLTERIPLSAVVRVESTSIFVQRRLGVGTVTITAVGGGRITMLDVPRPDEVRDLLWKISGRR